MNLNDSEEVTFSKLHLNVLSISINRLVQNSLYVEVQGGLLQDA